VPLIWARGCTPSRSVHCLPRAHLHPNLGQVGFFNPFFCILTPLQEISLTEFIGYKDGIKGYKIWNLETKKVVYSRDVVFR
jgi:hypothetical protein